MTIAWATLFFPVAGEEVVEEEVEEEEEAKSVAQDCTARHRDCPDGRQGHHRSCLTAYRRTFRISRVVESAPSCASSLQFSLFGGVVQ
jgi:hypothetical protein